MLVAGIVSYDIFTALYTPYTSDEDISLATAFVGVGQLVLLAVQSFIFYRQANLMNTQKNLMNAQTNEIKTQTTLALQSYIATHPPLIRVRPIMNVVTPFNEGVGTIITIVRIPIINIGSTNATVVSIGAVMFEMQPDGHIKTPWTPEGKEQKISMVPGHLHVLQGDSSNGILEYKLTPNSNNVLYLRGEIVYTDDRGTIRTTSFIRNYEAMKRGFLNWIKQMFLLNMNTKMNVTLKNFDEVHYQEVWWVSETLPTMMALPLIPESHGI